MSSHPLSHHELTYARLVAEYVGSLTDKLAVLDRALTGARDNPTALAEAREVAHRMRGTAGCYGFRELSDVAGILDDQLTAIQRGMGGSWADIDCSAELVRSIASGIQVKT